MSQVKVPAFLDGNSFVSYNTSIDKLIVGNSEGLIKVFNTSETELEPTSIDSIENLTSLSSYSEKLLVTSTSGNLELINLSRNESDGIIYRSELPLRDSIFINEGKRILCGGDDNKLFIIDHENNNTVTSITIPDQLLNLSYNMTGEILSLSLSNGDLQIYSVINEVPNLIDTIKSVLPSKINTSMDSINYIDEHSDELITTKTLWTSDGEHILVPTSNNSIKVYNRSDLTKFTKNFNESDDAGILYDFQLFSNDKYIALLCEDSTIKVYIFKTGDLIADFELEILKEDYKTINFVINNDELYVGTANGEIIRIEKLHSRISSSSKSSKSNLILGEADESDGDDDADSEDISPESKVDLKKESNGHKLHAEDSMIIDEDEDEEDEEEAGPDPMRFYNKGVDDLFEERKSRKRQKPSGTGYVSKSHDLSSNSIITNEELVPYSPGSTPWSRSESSGTSIATTARRYLTMNSIGYVWSVKNNSINEKGHTQQSISVSFFDRTVNKDYHFIDYSQFDLCSMNDRGILLATSGHKEKGDIYSGRVYYRHHNSINDSWERKVPLLAGEHLTSISITGTNGNINNSNSIIIIGSNFGYVRFFNLYGLCINLIKTTPVVTLISSSSSTLFIVNQISHNVYSYSLLDVNQDYKFIQQDVLLPLKKSTNSNRPLIKGIFFNEYNDPCLVAGSDDTLIILASWREVNNAKWIPILNCNDIISEYGHNESKRHWKCWPLGLQKDQLNCLVLKNNSSYPGFPLPLPIELNIKLPISAPEKPKNKKHRSKTPDDLFGDEGNGSDDESNFNNNKDDDPEENFLRASTMGKIVNDSLNDEDIGDDNEEILERLQGYSVLFDKSLLKLFATACQDSRLNKALSIVRLIKNDKALLAAAKIAERFEFLNLASKIGKLREDLINLSDDEDGDEDEDD